MNAHPGNVAKDGPATSSVSSSDATTALRLQLLRRGYEPIPIVAHDARGKSPGKRPSLPGWQTLPLDETVIRDWQRGKQRNNPGTGLRCGRLRAIDIDILESALANSIVRLAERLLPPTSLKRVGKAPKILLCFRANEPRPKRETSVFILPDGSKAQIEIMGSGQLIVGYGIHPITKRDYEWIDSGPGVVSLVDLSVLTAEEEAAFLLKAEQMICEAGGLREKHFEPDKKPKESNSSLLLSKNAGENCTPSPEGNFFRNVNSLALANIEPWFKRLFPSGYWQPNAAKPPGAWRVRSADINRGLEEDIAVHVTEGGHDFGTRQSKTPIDLVMEHGGAASASDAALELCESLRVEPSSLGWQQRDAGNRSSEGNKYPRRSTGSREEHPKEGWPVPIDFLADDEKTGVPELREEHVPQPLWGFSIDTGARMGVDPAGVALIALATCASVMSDEWKIQPKRYDYTWTENPRLWTAIVGDPSVLKSPIISVCTKPIDILETRSREQHAQAMQKFKADHAAWKKAKDDPATEPRPPRLDRYMVEGTTIEALTEALRDDTEAKQRAPAGKILVRQDEMSEWLASFDRYRSGGTGSGDRGAYLRLYNGGRYTIDRVVRGSFAVPNWSACFVGGIQPGPIQKVAQNADDDGLLQRFCFCVPEKPRPGQDREPDRAAVNRYYELVSALTALRPARTNFGAPVSPVVLHADAHSHRESIDALARALAAMPDTSDRMKAAFGKWPGLWARIALVFHLIEHADGALDATCQAPIHLLSEATARKASAYIEQILLPHLLRADNLMYATKLTGHARWIALYILARGHEQVALRNIVQDYGALRAPERRRELLEAMEGLVSMGWVYPMERSDPSRPPASWLVNPMVLTRFAARGEAERAYRKQTREDISEVIRKRRSSKS